MRVRFTSNFNYAPTPQVTTAYKAGMEMTVKRECAEQAIAAGKAVEVPPVGRVADDADKG